MATGRIARTDTSLLGRWWWQVDGWNLAALVTLMGIGILLVFAASPSVAEHLGLSSFFFVKRHIMYVLLALATMITVSLMNIRNIRRIAILMFVGSVVAVIMTLFSGAEIKGARRWISLGGVSIQPSEFLKTSFTILAAWMFAEKRLYPEFPGMFISALLYFLSAGLLILQPDLGMVILVSCVWFGQLFIAGLSLIWVAIASIAGVSGLGLAYIFLPHVQKRVGQFLGSSGGDRYSDQYQITQSLESFINGGFFGRGPGEGIVKKHLPDAHADFIFAVAGEEFGAIMCLVIVGLFLMVVLRTLYRLTREENLFVVLAVSGLTIQFGLQAFINICSSLGLIPTKGMTLPFLSYGGSSLLSISILAGMLLALTKERGFQR